MFMLKRVANGYVELGSKKMHQRFSSLALFLSMQLFENEKHFAKY